MPSPADQFAKAVIAAGLSSADEIKAIWNSLPAGQRPKDGETLAELLVKEAKITQFQASELLSGGATPLVLGDYVLLDTIGAGGMGQVFKARHRRMKRLVAIKLLPSALSKDAAAIKRFEREVEAAAKLTHPNIVVAFDAGHAKEQHFLVMEYVDGTDLSSHVKRNGPLPVQQAVHCILQTARGLEYAHEQGVVHRDIKPANLLLDRKGAVKILDMGLARLDAAGLGQDELTGTGQIMGTVDYMAPEQAMKTKDADARADVYSLGITLWYLLTGKPAYEGDTVLEKLMAHQMRPIPSLSAACPSVFASLDAAFARMVAKRPEDRYQTMGDVIAALDVCGTEFGAAPLQNLGSVEARSTSAAPGVNTESGTAVAPGLQPTFVLAAPTPAVVAETITVAAPEQSTDPQTQKSLSAATPQPVAQPALIASRPPRSPSWRSRRALVAAAGAAALLLVWLGIWVIVRDKDGNEIARFKVPQGGSVEVKDNAAVPQGVNKATPRPDESWHGWPKDAPPPAIAPFEADQARKHQEEWAAYLKVPVEYTNSIGMKFVLIPPGEFMMGSTPEEIQEAILADEGVGDHWLACIKSGGPRHKVILTQPILVGVHEVTQKQFEQVMGKNPSNFAPMGDKKDAVAGMDTTSHPVEQVNWSDAAEFCTKLSQLEKRKPFKFELRAGEPETNKDTGYRLPTEAEWEFVCRAGTTTRYWISNQDEDLPQAAWLHFYSGGRTHAVGELKSNPFGLYDCHGNVGEWVRDRWEPTYYGQFQREIAIDPTGPTTAFSGQRSVQVFRGGDWYYGAIRCRASNRTSNQKTHSGYDIGFRVSLPVAAVRQALK